MASLEELTVVALLTDVPAEELVRGQVGTIVASLAPGVFDVEFADHAGQTYALCPLQADQLLALQFQQVTQAA